MKQQQAMMAKLGLGGPAGSPGVSASPAGPKGGGGSRAEAWSAQPGQKQSLQRKVAAPSPQRKPPAAKLVLEDLDEGPL